MAVRSNVPRTGGPGRRSSGRPGFGMPGSMMPGIPPRRCFRAGRAHPRRPGGAWPHEGDDNRALHPRGHAPDEGRERADERGAVGSRLSATATQTATLGCLMNQAQSLPVPGEGLRAAEDRGFEPRKVSPPNRISSALLRVTDTSAPVRDCAGTQVTTAFTCRAVPGLTGTARPFCACLVRAQCVLADRPVRQAERSPATNGEPGLSAHRPRLRRLRPPFEGP